MASENLTINVPPFITSFLINQVMLTSLVMAVKQETPLGFWPRSLRLGNILLLSSENRFVDKSIFNLTEIVPYASRQDSTFKYFSCMCKLCLHSVPLASVSGAEG